MVFGGVLFLCFGVWLLDLLFRFRLMVGERLLIEVIKIYVGVYF